VFGHEAGHVKKHHILFLLLFAASSLMIAGGLVELAEARWEWLDRQVLEAGALVVVALVWLVGFGWVSRRFERQADVFGVQVLSESIRDFRMPFAYHQAYPRGPARRALCMTAAVRFAGALERIAVLNGIPVHARSWRHSSIASRARLVQTLAAHPARLARFQRVVLATKVGLVLVSAAAAAVTVWLYWPF